jgi:predicted ATP-binding protein involved in virulence
MARPIIIILGAIPVLAAIFIVVPQLLRPEISSVTVNPEDVMTLEYTKEHLKKISFGLTQSIGADIAEVLTVQNDGSTTYSLTKNGNSEPDVKYQLTSDELKQLKSLIKETGFMDIPDTDYQVKPDLNEYEKYGLQATFNGKTVNLHWSDQNSSQQFVPPIIMQVQSNLDDIIGEIIK